MTSDMRESNHNGHDGRRSACMWVLCGVGSMKLALVIVAVFAVAIAVATFIEVPYGPEGARAMVYNAWWFEALLGLLIINLAASLLAHTPFRRSQIGFVLAHIGFIVVLVGAGVTRYMGFEGRISIRENESSNEAYSMRDYIHITVGSETASFPVRLYKPGDMNLTRTLEVGDHDYHVSVTRYLPRAKHEVVKSPGGRPTLVFASNGRRANGLMQGDTAELQGVTIRFVEEDPVDFGASSSRGTLIVKLGEAMHRLAVDDMDKELVTDDGYRIRIAEFAANFRLERKPEPGDAMVNPAVRVEIETPEGEVGERLLFAYHPDFDAAHAGQSTVGHIPMMYRHPRSIQLFLEGETLMGRADCTVERAGHASDGQMEAVPPGTRFVVDKYQTLTSGAFTFLLTTVWPAGAEAVVPTDNPDSQPAVTMTIRDVEANEAEVTILKWQQSHALVLDSEELVVAFRPRRYTLPYQIHLDDFVLSTYPGSQNPSSFESHVRIHDEKNGVEGAPARIHMNHPLTYRGYKHFQSSYDSDHLGTILSVNKDPGKQVTYVGYGLVTLGFLITLSRRFWNRRGQNAKRLAAPMLRRMAAGVAIAAILLFAFAGRSQPQDHNHRAGQDGDHTEASAPPLARNFLSDDARDALRTVMVQDFQGRIKPFDTLSRETVMKITKRYRFEAWQAIDLYSAWMIQPQPWFRRNMIAVRYPGVKDLIGMDSDAKRTSVLSLVDANGGYKLAGNVERAMRTPASERDKTQQKLLLLDERVNVFDMVIRQMTFRVFPVPDDANNRWLAPAELSIEPDAIAGEDRARCLAAWELLAVGLRTGDNDAVICGADAIRSYQSVYGASIVPADRAVAAELMLNRVDPFTWVTLPYLLAFVLLIGAYTRGLARSAEGAFRASGGLYSVGVAAYVAGVLWHVLAYVLRWTASGRAPLSNGYESLLFISVMSAVAGLYYEKRARNGSVGALAALLTAIILGVAMLPSFDPAIGPLQPVLSSYWLIIHVTVITASYGFLGLAAMAAMAILVMFLFKRPGRDRLHMAIRSLYGLQWNIMVAGVAFLAIGTLLGAVWANESWGRYWGWDPKETWALVTILAYAFVIHMRFTSRLSNPATISVGTMLSILVVGMTYFGVNYFLVGLHSYAEGTTPGVPGWVYAMVAAMILLSVAALRVDSRRTWQRHPDNGATYPGRVDALNRRRTRAVSAD